MFRKPRRFVIEALEERLVLSLPDAAPSLGPPPSPGPGVVWVSDAPSLQDAVNKAQSGETIVIEPGTYNLTETLNLGLSSPVANVTIRGATDNFGDVVIHGFGMDNPNFGNCPFDFQLWNAVNVTIADLSAGDAWDSAVQIQGTAQQVHLYHDRFFDTGEQLVKSNPTGSGTGVNDSSLEYSVLEYTNGPSLVNHGGGTGYTNALSAITIQRWTVANNLIRNLYTPDTAQNLWNPAILIWGNSADCVVEGNTIVNSDRAIAFGLYQNPNGPDDSGGIIRNNFIVQEPGLFSAGRKFASDGMVIAWDSPGTAIDHNTILTNGNSNFAIEVRWVGTGVEVRNNLADAPINARDGAIFDVAGDYLAATPDMFADPASGDLHLVQNAATAANVIDKVTAPPDVTDDWDGEARPIVAASDTGADESSGNSPTIAPPPVTSGLTIADAGFEMPGGLTGFSGYVYNPAGSAWTFDTGSGLSGNGSAFTSGNPSAPEGSQVAFLQGSGSFRQSVTGWTAGAYQLSFAAAQRGNWNATSQGEDFEVLIDGNVVGTFQPDGTVYRPYATPVFTVTDGPHTITFQGLDSAGGDNTAFLDSVSVTAAPQPTAADGSLGNGGFESPGVSGYIYNPTAPDWVFTGCAGLSGNNTAFTSGNPAAPEGSQVAFLQSHGTISQTIGGLAAGSYQLTFDAAERGNYNANRQDFQVTVDNIVIGYFLPNGTDYQPFTTTFSVSGGTHTIAFQGLDSAGGDNTAFIDDVRLTQNT